MAEVTKRLVLLYHGAKEARGGWFEPSHRMAVTQAAGEAGHTLIELERAKLDQIDPDMPAGVFAANGRPDPLPVMLQATFDRLMELVEAGQAGKPPRPFPVEYKRGKPLRSWGSCSSVAHPARGGSC